MFTFVFTAIFANTVSEFHLAAVIASDHAWHLELEVRAALTLYSFGSSSLRYCHAGHLLTVLFVLRILALLVEKLGQPGKSWIHFRLFFFTLGGEFLFG